MIPRLYFADLKSKKFSGFKVSWKYNHDPSISEQILNFYESINYKYTTYGWNLKFINLANLVHSTEYSKSYFFTYVRDYKKKRVNRFTAPFLSGYNHMGEVYDAFFKQISLLNETAFNISDPLYANEISYESLVTAAKMLFYITTSQKGRYWFDWYTLYSTWINNSKRRLLGKKFRLYNIELFQMLFCTLGTVAGVLEVSKLHEGIPLQNIHGVKRMIIVLIFG